MQEEVDQTYRPIRVHLQMQALGLFAGFHLHYGDELAHTHIPMAAMLPI